MDGRRRERASVGTGGPPPGDLPAGDVGPWADDLEAALRGERDADVPCGTCTACCSSGQFVLVGPDEVEALARIPRALRFPAPGSPPGHVVLPYDERGRCPMLGDAGCTIYEHRPRTCRTYDCRVFAATGIAVDARQPRIAERVRRWRFGATADGDRALGAALRAAGAWLDADDEGRRLPAPQRAALAVELRRSFEGGGRPDPDAVRVEIRRRRGPAAG